MYLTEDKPYCFMHLFDIIGLANEISQKSIKKIPTLRNIWSSLKDKTFKQLRIQDWLINDIYVLLMINNITQSAEKYRKQAGRVYMQKLRIILNHRLKKSLHITIQSAFNDKNIKILLINIFS